MVTFAARSGHTTSFPVHHPQAGWRRVYQRRYYLMIRRQNRCGKYQAPRRRTRSKIYIPTMATRCRFHSARRLGATHWDGLQSPESRKDRWSGEGARERPGGRGGGVTSFETHGGIPNNRLQRGGPSRGREHCVDVVDQSGSPPNLARVVPVPKGHVNTRADRLPRPQAPVRTHGALDRYGFAEGIAWSAHLDRINVCAT